MNEESDIAFNAWWSKQETDGLSQSHKFSAWNGWLAGRAAFLAIMRPGGYGDDDERWGETVEQYVDGCADSHDYDDLISGEPFTVDAYFSRTEQWRVVSTSPTKCERIALPEEGEAK